MKRIAKILLAVALVVCCLLGMMVCAQAATEKGIVTSPKAGTAYKFGFNNGTTTYYFTGSMQGYYGATTTDAASAVDVYLESVTGGYYLYFMDGNTKTYIYIYEYIPNGSQYPKGSFGITTSKPEQAFTYNSQVNTLVCTYGENSYFMGTWGTYNTISASSTYYIEGDKLADVDKTQYPARLYAEKEAATPLTITKQPTSKIVKAGETAKITLRATGTGLKYQWQYRTSSTGSWKSASASGNKTRTISIPATVGRHSYQYRCKITDSTGKTVYSEKAVLYVLGVKTQPVSKTVVEGNTAKLSVVATGRKVTYQWQYRTSSKGSWAAAKATGNKTATLSIPATAGRHGYQYRCKITDSKGNVVYTNTVSLYVLGIKTQPVSKTVKVGATAKFTVSAVGRGLTFQWQYRKTTKGKWITAKADGNTTKTLSVPGTTSRNGYEYRCKITDAAGNVLYSNIVKLTVKK